MASLRVLRGRFHATVTKVGGNQSVGEERYDTRGQFNNFTPPPIAERIIFTRDTGQPLQERVPGGIEDMDCVFELGAPNDIFKMNLGRTIQMTFYVAEEHGGGVEAAAEVKQYDSRRINIHGVVTRVEDGTITIGENNPQTVTIRVTEKYTETVVTPTNDTVQIIEIDNSAYNVTLNGVNLTGALEAALGLSS